MSKAQNDVHDAILDIGLDQELGISYGRYAQTIILDRAIPDVRDGLKPVQRRILYAMFNGRNMPDKPYRKSAKTIGDVMGNYHPHGDQSIYEALVRLSQPWKMRQPLVDGHGNFGSIDDDPPAAMRYTEARLAPASLELLAEIENDTVPWRLNFDESTTEPEVLPAAYPNLLANGASGVSTGFATEIPPHNLSEVCEAVCLRIDHPQSGVDELLDVMPGPDFPTGGIVLGRDGIREAYETGRGRVKIRARHTMERGEGGRPLFVVHELPYGVVKANLVRELDQLRQNRAVQGLVDVRDESDREGLRLIIEVQRGADEEGIWNYLLRKTSLQVYFHFNMVAIHEHRPFESGVIGLLDAYLDHRRKVLRQSATFKLKKTMERLHLVEGLIRAVDVLDEVIATIRASEDRARAHSALMERFAFTDAQTEAILDLRLHRLTGLQITALRAELDELNKKRAALERLLGSQKLMDKEIKIGLRDVAKRLGDARRTEIQDETGNQEVALEVRVKPQSTVVVVTDRGYIKRSSLQSFMAAGGSPESAGVRDGDFPRFVLTTNTIHRVLLFTARGAVYSLPAHMIPEARFTDLGMALVNVVPFEKDDQLVGVVAPESYSEEHALVFLTERGQLKLTTLDHFDLRRSGASVATRLLGKDRVAAVISVAAESDLLVLTRLGQSIRFPLAQVNPQGRNARGVRAMGVDPGDAVVTGLSVPPAAELTCQVAIFTQSGKGKRTPLESYPRQHRGGKGVRTVMGRGRQPHLLCAAALTSSDENLFLLFDNEGVACRIASRELRCTRRDGNVFRISTLAGKRGLKAALPVAPEGNGAEGDASPESGEGDAAPVPTENENTPAPPDQSPSPSHQLTLLPTKPADGGEGDPD